MSEFDKVETIGNFKYVQSTSVPGNINAARHLLKNLSIFL